MSIDPSDQTLPEGDTVEDNQYTRYLEKNYNINIVVDWSAAQGDNFNQKVSLAIASGDLPDGVVANDRTYMMKAAKSELLYDLSGLFDEVASTQVKDIMASTNGRAMNNVMYDDKMVALPNVIVETDGIHMMLIRKDWLDELNLPIPETLTDIEDAAQAFVDNNMAGDKTIGIVGPDKNEKAYCNFLESNNAVHGLDPVFQAMDAYPGYWITDESGDVVYGTITDETKQALSLLADWYDKGLIDPEMGTRDSSSEVVNANQAGIFFGPWWSLGYGNGDSFKNDPEANWQAYPVYDDNGDWNVHMATVGTQYTLVSKNASEDVAKAILIMNNALVRDESTFDISVGIGWYPLRNVMAAADESEHEYRELMKILKGETEPEDYNNPNSLYKLMYSDAQVVRDVVKKDEQPLNIGDFDQSDFGSFQRLYALLVGDRPYATVEPAKKVSSVTYSQTETMERKWANLKKLEEEIILKIILGQEPIEKFDDFVDDWRTQGGDEVTAEVQEIQDQK